MSRRDLEGAPFLNADKMALGRLAPKMKRPEPAPPSFAAQLVRSPPTWLLGAVYSVLYLVFSTTIILANKHIITQTNFNCPIAVSSLGSLFGWVVSVLARERAGGGGGGGGGRGGGGEGWREASCDAPYHHIHPHTSRAGASAAFAARV